MCVSQGAEWLAKKSHKTAAKGPRCARHTNAAPLTVCGLLRHFGHYQSLCACTQCINQIERDSYVFQAIFDAKEHALLHYHNKSMCGQNVAEQVSNC